jgi:NOL1/NOP2/fmu family ribosome biogenesis protein
MSKYVVCHGKEYIPGKYKFTEIGVGFETRDKKGIRLQIDLTLILSPNEPLFVFLRKPAVEIKNEDNT